VVGVVVVVGMGWWWWWCDGDGRKTRSRRRRKRSRRIGEGGKRTYVNAKIWNPVLVAKHLIPLNLSRNPTCTYVLEGVACNGNPKHQKPYFCIEAVRNNFFSRFLVDFL
jgi:hypothetical protein